MGGSRGLGMCRIWGTWGTFARVLDGAVLKIWIFRRDTCLVAKSLFEEIIIWWLQSLVDIRKRADVDGIKASLKRLGPFIQ